LVSYHSPVQGIASPPAEAAARALGAEGDAGSVSKVVLAPQHAARVTPLDGVRGMAILIVMLHHAMLCAPIKATSGWQKVVSDIAGEGWIGVDLFFVLSGYLITTILLRTRDQSNYYRNFYARRTLRIFPLYYAAVLLTCVVFPLVSHGNMARSLWTHQAWYWLYIPNILIFVHGNWFNSLFDHTWSLAIEEQFYLVWPLTVRLLGARRLAPTVVVIALASSGLRVWMSAHGYSEAQIRALPLSHCDGLALGALLSSLEALKTTISLRRQLGWALLLAGAILRAPLLRPLIGNAVHDNALVGTGWTLMFGGILALLVTAPGAGLARAFSVRPLVFLGTYSYGIYLIHMPLMLAGGKVLGHVAALEADQALTALLLMVFAGGFAIVLAVLSFRYFEGPFLKLKTRFG
jgi:peptidoglycan/LPS O-acetylase OafA/YrhL